MAHYCLREWERLPHGVGKGQIPEVEADRLVAVARASVFAGRGEGGVLEHHRTYIRARGVVGVLASPGVSLEILPKIDLPPGEARGDESAAVRKRLVHMLAVALDLRLETGAITELSWQRDTFLEILIRLFCEKLTAQVRRGIPRRYLTQEDDLSVLRGKLDTVRQFTYHAANPSRLACRYDTLSENIALNQIMKAAIGHLVRLSHLATNQQRLRELAFVYAEIPSASPSALRWEAVELDRTNRGWLELLALAKLFLRNRYQTTSAGAAPGTALLFEMDALFEEYIGRLIARALARSGHCVSLQGGHLFCLSEAETARGLFRTKPDILIRRGGEVVQVIDTKWKRIAARLDDPKQGVSQADVYQMMAYAQLYKAPRLTLLYPHHAGLAGEGVQGRFCISGHDARLETASIDVAQGARGVLERLRLLLPAGATQRGDCF